MQREARSCFAFEYNMGVYFIHDLVGAERKALFLPTMRRRRFVAITTSENKIS